MKLVIAVVNVDDVNAVTQGLTRGGFSATRLSTTGGFLMAKNATLLVGVDAGQVDAVLEIIKSKSHSRKQIISASTHVSRSFAGGHPVEVNVGGATIFVVDVEQFHRF